MHNQILYLKINEQYQSPVKKKISHINEREFPNYDNQAVVENWKGLDMMWEKKGTYLDKDSTVLFYNDTCKTKSSYRNPKKWKFCRFKNIFIDGQLYNVRNTCTFDNTVHINGISYSTWIDLNNNYSFFALIEK